MIRGEPLVCLCFVNRKLIVATKAFAAADVVSRHRGACCEATPATPSKRGTTPHLGCRALSSGR